MFKRIMFKRIMFKRIMFKRIGFKNNKSVDTLNKDKFEGDLR